jgi:hypothetical protein
VAVAGPARGDGVHRLSSISLLLVSIWGAIVGILLSRAPRITQLDKLRDRFLDKRGARAVRVPVYCFFFSPTP